METFRPGVGLGGRAAPPVTITEKNKRGGRERKREIGFDAVVLTERYPRSY